GARSGDGRGHALDTAAPRPFFTADRRATRCTITRPRRRPGEPAARDGAPRSSARCHRGRGRRRTSATAPPNVRGAEGAEGSDLRAPRPGQDATLDAEE